MVTDFIYDGWVVWAAPGGVAALLAALWFLRPLVRRASRLGRERTAVGRRRRRELAAEVLAQVRGGAEAAAVRRSRRSLASPASSAARAASTRWASSQRRTETPVSAAKRRANVRSETWAWRGEVAHGQRLVEAFERPGAGGGERAAGAGAAARRTATGRRRGAAGRRAGARSGSRARRRGRAAGCAGRGRARRRRRPRSARRPRRRRARRARRARAGGARRGRRRRASGSWRGGRRAGRRRRARTRPVQIEATRAPRAWARAQRLEHGLAGHAQVRHEARHEHGVRRARAPRGPACATIVEARRGRRSGRAPPRRPSRGTATSS